MPLLQGVWEDRSKVDLATQDRRYRHDDLRSAQPLWPGLYSHRISLLYDRVDWVFQEDAPALLLDSLRKRLCQRLDSTLDSILLCAPHSRRELLEASAASKIEERV